MRIYIRLSSFCLLLINQSTYIFTLARAMGTRSKQHEGTVCIATIITRGIFISERAYGRNAKVYFSQLFSCGLNSMQWCWRLDFWCCECGMCNTKLRTLSCSICAGIACILCSALCFRPAHCSVHIIHVGRRSIRTTGQRPFIWRNAFLFAARGKYVHFALFIFHAARERERERCCLMSFIFDSCYFEIIHKYRRRGAGGYGSAPQMWQEKCDWNYSCCARIYFPMYFRFN